MAGWAPLRLESQSLVSGPPIRKRSSKHDKQVTYSMIALHVDILFACDKETRATLRGLW